MGPNNSPTKIPEYEQITQQIHSSIDRILSKLDPVLTNYPTKEVLDGEERPTTILVRFSDIAHRLQLLEDRIVI